MLLFVHMGAGKGQPRRAEKAIAVTSKVSADKNLLQEVTYDQSLYGRWYEWIESMGARDIDLINFYFGSTTTKTWRNLTDEERIFIINELFRDAVDIGVIVLPAQVDVKDFSFKFDRAHRASQYDFLSVEYSPPGVKKKRGRIVWTDFCLDRRVDTSDCLLKSFVAGAQDATRAS